MYVVRSFLELAVDGKLFADLIELQAKLLVTDLKNLNRKSFLVAQN